MSEIFTYNLSDVILNVTSIGDRSCTIQIPASQAVIETTADGTARGCIELDAMSLYSTSLESVFDVLKDNARFGIEVLPGLSKAGPAICEPLATCNQCKITAIKVIAHGQPNPGIRVRYCFSNSDNLDETLPDIPDNTQKIPKELFDSLFRIARALEDIKRSMSKLGDMATNLNQFYESPDMELTVDEFQRLKLYGILPEKYYNDNKGGI